MRLRFGAPLQLNQAGLRQLSDRGFPAHAGMDLVRISSSLHISGLPRTRGDGPDTDSADGTTAAASPHTRGWTHAGNRKHDCEGGFPAHAGMDPVQEKVQARMNRLPRTRGDGPTELMAQIEAE